MPALHCLLVAAVGLDEASQRSTGGSTRHTAGNVDIQLLRSLWPQSESLLNASQLDSGVELAGADDRLACVRAALSRREPVSIGAIGGSITAGSNYAVRSGATHLYHHKLLAALDAIHPVRNGHSLSNGGVPGTGPTYMEHCVHDHMPRRADLLLVEYAVNTDRNPASFERLLRTLLLLPHAPAVVVVNAHRWRAVRPQDGRTDKCWNSKWPVDMAANATQRAAQSWGSAGQRDEINSDEDAIADLCRHYNVPLVSMRGALLGAVRSGTLSIPAFMRDCKHPAGEGHTYLAQLLLHRLLSPPALTQAPPARGHPNKCRRAPAALAGPLHGESGRESAASVCARGSQLPSFVASAQGFELTDEGRGPGKLGYVASQPGDSLSLCLPFPAGGAAARSPKVLWLGYLRSYEHMGRVRVSCDGGCSCLATLIDAHDTKDGVSVTDVRRVVLRAARRGVGEAREAAGRGAGCCSVRLQVAQGSSSGEHKFKLMSLLLGGADANSLQTFSLRVAASASETAVAGGRSTGTGG